MALPPHPLPANPLPADLFIGYTTLPTSEAAKTVARGLVEAHLAVCTQVEGPLLSTYRWEGQIESAEEYRVVVKFTAKQAEAIDAWLHAHHPYAVPQWVAVPVHFVGGKYLSWVHQLPTH